MRYVATHEIDEKPVYDHRTGELLVPHLLKVGGLTECEAMIRHQLIERVPIVLARGKKVRCQWLDEMKEGTDGAQQARFEEVAHGIRFNTFAGTDHHRKSSVNQESRRATHPCARVVRHQRCVLALTVTT